MVVADVRADRGEAVAGALGERAASVALDVTDAGAWDACLAEAEGRFGPVSVLVNNAGIVHEGPLAELSEADYRRVVDVNQVGVFLGMRAVVPSMRRAGGGSIVNVSSIGGIVAFPGVLGYVAAKWAVRGMTKAAAQELAADGVRVNSVYPGLVETDMTPPDTPAAAQVRTQPIPRLGRPEEIADLVLFLASDESSYCTGAEFVADGGFTTR